MDKPFRERFRNASPQQLVDALNSQVGNPGWVTARGFYLAALKEAFIASGLDCSDFIKAGRMTVTRIKLDGEKVVSVGERPNPPLKSNSRKALHLVYGTDYGLVFVERFKAQEQKAFNEARTWGEFRHNAPILYQRALELIGDDDFDAEGVSTEPADEVTFDPNVIPGFQDGDFLDFPQQLMLDFVPEAAQKRFGRVVESVLNGPMLLFDADKEEGVVTALTSQGFTCKRDEGLVSEYFR